jgi:predicted RecB family nuclease
MYLNHDGCRRYSPTDLIAYLEGDFAAWCERLAAERASGSGNDPLIPPDEPDPERELVAAKGMEHESRYLGAWRTREPGLVELSRKSPPADTLAAMRGGAPVIFQAHLENGAWHGYPDFLVRVDGASGLGPWHYEPWDTKLARSPRPYFLTQLCAYADLLEKVQGRRPQSLTVVLGNGEERRFATDEFFYHFLQVRDSFLAFQEGWSPGAMPHPGLDRGWGRWTTAAEALLERSDHLSRVANITRGQIRRFEEAGIATLTALAASDGQEIPHIAGAVRQRLRSQAALQLASHEAAAPLWELRPPEAEPRRGLALLPPPAPLDVYFDMEGFPFAEGGLEYLFGAAADGPDGPAFQDWWGHRNEDEKRAFEGFIDYVMARWRQDPAMHVYHYAPYERTALRRLMGKYATREAEVDDLLRHGVLVDLYAVVRQGFIVGTPSYSLKDIERLYLPPRESEVTSAGGSIVEYQRWLDSGEPPAWQQSPILSAIRDYNRVDCESAGQLRAWLVARQAEAGISYVPENGGEAPAPGGPDRERTPAEILAETLLTRAADGSETDPERRRVTELLGWLVEFHRREERPMWWRMFERNRSTEEELRDDFDCLAGLTRTGRPPRPVKKSYAYEYAFDATQETRMSVGSRCYVAGDLECRVEILTFDGEAGLLELKAGPKATLPDRLSLIPDEYVPSDLIKDAVLRFAQSWADGAGVHPCVEDLLFRRPPRIRAHPGGSLVDQAAGLLSQVVSLAGRLDGTTLCIQGPPGTGKTFTAAAVIADLLSRGKRVGITANSHKVILNLMGAVAKAMQGSKPVPMYKVGGETDDPLFDGVIAELKSADVAGVVGGGAVLVGGTAWVFTRPELAGRFDYLFVDEAGQVSLANAVAVGLSAANLVLIGDQMQLSQPTQNTHPGESGRSCLVYALHGHATIPPEFGIFLGTSWRMHPDVCRFISGAIYDGRLTSHADTERQTVTGARPGGLVPRETGIVFVPVEHVGCTQWSDDETDVIGRIVDELRNRVVVDREGCSHPFSLDDVLFVAPFNMQVRKLRERYGAGARVGSVDRFQGQEAPVVIVSLCASSLEEAPRGASFLLDRNRLNVAVSRAQALAIVVASPALLAARCGSIEEMALVNVLCRLARQ